MIVKELNNFIKNSLLEDLGEGDHSSLGTIPKDVTKKAKFVSGPFTNMIFEILEKQKNKLKAQLFYSFNP